MIQETHSLTKFVLVPGGRTYMSETLRTWVMPLGLASQAAIKQLTRLGGIVKWYHWYHGGTAFWTNPSIEAGGLDKICCHRLLEIKTLTERPLKCVPHTGMTKGCVSILPFSRWKLEADGDFKAHQINRPCLFQVTCILCTSQVERIRKNFLRNVVQGY